MPVTNIQSIQSVIIKNLSRLPMGERTWVLISSIVETNYGAVTSATALVQTAGLIVGRLNADQRDQIVRAMRSEANELDAAQIH